MHALQKWVFLSRARYKQDASTADVCLWFRLDSFFWEPMCSLHESSSSTGHFNTEWWLITDVVWRRRCVSVFRDPSVPCAGVIGTRVCSSPAARRCTCFAWSIAWPVFSSCVDRSSPERFTRRRTCPSSACRLASAHTCLLPSLPPSRYKTASSAPYISDLILYSNWVHHTKSRVFFQAVKMHDHNTHL